MTRLLPIRPELVTDLQRRLAALGRYEGDLSGVYDAATREAVAGWAGEHNLEGRLRDDDQLSNLLVVGDPRRHAGDPRPLGRTLGHLLEEADDGGCRQVDRECEHGRSDRHRHHEAEAPDDPVVPGQAVV